MTVPTGRRIPVPLPQPRPRAERQKGANPSLPLTDAQENPARHVVHEVKDVAPGCRARTWPCAATRLRNIRSRVTVRSIP